eukprot:732389-Amphidinium_carterae.1
MAFLRYAQAFCSWVCFLIKFRGLAHRCRHMTWCDWGDASKKQRSRTKAGRRQPKWFRRSAGDI